MAKKILLVDDESYFLWPLIKKLEEAYPGYEIMEKNTYPEGLEFALQNLNSVKLAILDGKLLGYLGSDIGIAMRTAGSRAVIYMFSGSPVEVIIPDVGHRPLFDGVFEKGNSLSKFIAELKVKLPI